VSGEPDTTKRYQACRVEFEHTCNRFAVHYGYKGRSQVQVRLDGEEVYLSVHDEARYPDRLVSVSVPFELFAEKLPEFIRHLQAVRGVSGE
jgi:hypothetical protein